MGFFPAIGIICGFFALESLSGWAYQRSPKLLVSNDKIDRAFQSAEDSRALHDSGTAFWAGPIWVVSPKEIDQSLWKMKIASGVSFLSRKLSPVPLHPFVELRPIESAEGQFSGITMALDPQSEDPFRALFHELTHLYLLWALIPGFPVDCPRWFNEGMAEELAGQILEDYSGRWMNDLVLDSAVVTFDQLSPAFSWDNSFVELQGRHAFHKFLEKYEWEGVRRVISGLRQGRPFRSVFMLEFGVPVELFQSECLCDFVKSKVLSRIPRKLIVGKLRWLAGNRPPSEVLPLIRKSEILLGKIQELESLEREIYEKKIRQCLSIKHPNEALFWLSQIRRRHNHTSLVSLSKEIKDTAQFCENEIPRVQQFRERIYGFPHITAFILGYGLLSMYRRLRTAVKKWAWKAWHPDKESGLGFRWGMVAIFCLGWQWFIRFLLISGIPYGGIAAVPDFFRIVLAEVISVLGLVGLSWQLGKWDAKGSRSNLLKENGIPFRFLLLTVFCSLFPTFMAIAKNSGRYSGVEIDEFFIVGLLVILNIFATGIIFWRFSIRWKCGFPRMSHWFCGFSYAFFRGSVSIDILGRIFLVLFGKAISEHVSRTGNLFFGIYLDFLCQGLGVLLGTVHFPPFEPVGGWFQASRFENWWWLFPIVATFIIGRRSAIRHQMSA